MGVSIEYISASGKSENITPGFRSIMADLLGGYRGRKLYKDSIDDLKEIANNQMRGIEAKGFDWSQDIYDNINKVIDAIKKDGWVIITMEW